MTIVHNNTANATEINDAVKSILTDASSLGLKRVWGADPVRVPVFPSAAVVTGTTTTGSGSPTGTGLGLNYWTRHTHTMYVMLFYAKLQENEDLERAANRYAELVRDELHKNKTLDGLARQGWVSQIEPGVARRAGAKFRANRLTVLYLSETFI